MTEKRTEPRVEFLVRVPKALFDQLEPLRTEGGYETRNDAVLDSLRRNIKRVVKK